MYGGQQQHQQQGPPQPPYPWRPEWDNQNRNWYYINTQTGERSWEFPRGGPPQGEYQQQQYQQQHYQQQHYQQQQPQQAKPNHNMAYGAAGLAAGVLGGALLMHEGEKVEERWDGDKARFEGDVRRDEYRTEGAFDRAGQDVVDFPDDAARWTGRKVQEVEDIPQDVDQGFDRIGDGIERRWDNAVDDVEDAPDRVANFFGDEVGKADRFGDGIENSYDAGRDEGRRDDDW